MKVLITGIAGLLGSRMADWLVKNRPEVEIYGIDDLSGGYMENVPTKVYRFANADICSQGSVDALFDTYGPFDVVYHFAAYAAEGLSPFIRNFNYTNNLLATTNIVNACIKYDCGRLVFTSSMAVYGRGIKEGTPFHESDQPKPIDPYGVAKFACEQDIQIAGEQHGLDWCIIRPHNVYGIKQNIWDKYRNVLGIWMFQALNDQELTIYGDGQQTRAFSYIDDCTKPLWNAGTAKKASKKIINLGGTRDYTIKEAATILKDKIFEKETSFKYLEGRHEVKHAIPTSARSKILLDYQDLTPLDKGLSVMWDWAKEQPIRGQFLWSKYELDKGLYSFWRNKDSDS